MKFTTQSKALMLAEQTFRDYEAHHFAKGSEDGINKAIFNGQIANLMREAQLIDFSVSVINQLSDSVHQDNVNMGWWTNLATGEYKQRNMGELLCLVHSEISEAMEGYRKNLMDDKLTHRKMLEVELADAMIRIFDIAGSQGLDLGGAIAEKRAYNAQRADHKLENRKAEGGKAF